jgi:hypothetical protein
LAYASGKRIVENSTGIKHRSQISCPGLDGVQTQAIDKRCNKLQQTHAKEQSRIQKLNWIQKLEIQKLHVGFRNYPLDSETIS